MVTEAGQLGLVICAQRYTCGDGSGSTRPGSNSVPESIWPRINSAGTTPVLSGVPKDRS